MPPPADCRRGASEKWFEHFYVPQARVEGVPSRTRRLCKRTDDRVADRSGIQRVDVAGVGAQVFTFRTACAGDDARAARRRFE